jgi:DNA polymerase I-like protein with 3'-5' exonuclease and polymerase domains
MKQGLVLLEEKIRKLKLDAHFVANVHDEIQLEVSQEDSILVGELAVQSIQDAGEHFKLRCPLTGEYKLGKTWADTH